MILCVVAMAMAMNKQLVTVEEIIAETEQLIQSIMRSPLNQVDDVLMLICSFIHIPAPPEQIQPHRFEEQLQHYNTLTLEGISSLEDGRYYDGPMCFCTCRVTRHPRNEGSRVMEDFVFGRNFTDGIPRHHSSPTSYAYLIVEPRHADPNCSLAPLVLRGMGRFDSHGDGWARGEQVPVRGLFTLSNRLGGCQTPGRCSLDPERPMLEG